LYNPFHLQRRTNISIIDDILHVTRYFLHEVYFEWIWELLKICIISSFSRVEIQAFLCTKALSSITIHSANSPNDSCQNSLGNFKQYSISINNYCSKSDDVWIHLDQTTKLQKYDNKDILPQKRDLWYEIDCKENVQRTYQSSAL